MAFVLIRSDRCLQRFCQRGVGSLHVSVDLPRSAQSVSTRFAMPSNQALRQLSVGLFA